MSNHVDKTLLLSWNALGTLFNCSCPKSPCPDLHCHTVTALGQRTSWPANDHFNREPEQGMGTWNSKAMAITCLLFFQLLPFALSPLPPVQGVSSIHIQDISFTDDKRGAVTVAFVCCPWLSHQSLSARPFHAKASKQQVVFSPSRVYAFTSFLHLTRVSLTRLLTALNSSQNA